MRGFKIRFRTFDKIFKQALAQTYSSSPTFANESDFKHELFHHLHEMEINGHKLGDKLHNCSTCILHSEAKPINGLKGKGSYADLLICNPAIQREYNYKTEIVIELKSEIEKFSKYNGSVRRLYIASANISKVSRETIKRIISEQRVPHITILVFDRNSTSYKSASQSHQRTRSKAALAERVAKSIRETLRLYGDNLRDPYHGFFWRNYEYEDNKNWTFPCEGDFVAQLYHRLRSVCPQNDVQTEYVLPREYSTQSNRSPGRVDLFLSNGDESVGIEVKINYDNFKGKGESAETAKLSRKFDAMSEHMSNHTNMLVVIQGQDAHKGSNKSDTLRELRKSGSEFGLFYYDERANKAVGPVGP